MCLCIKKRNKEKGVKSLSNTLNIVLVSFSYKKLNVPKTLGFAWLCLGACDVYMIEVRFCLCLDFIFFYFRNLFFGAFCSRCVFDLSCEMVKMQRVLKKM